MIYEFKDSELYNRCAGNQEPDWSRFTHLKIHGICRYEQKDLTERCALLDVGLPLSRSDEIAIIGKHETHGVQIISSFLLPKYAFAAALVLSKRTGLVVEICHGMNAFVEKRKLHG